MQFMVQGAWGIVPVHLNELSPDAVRGTFPGICLSTGEPVSSEYSRRGGPASLSFSRCKRTSRYAKALGLFALVIFLMLILLTAIGPEKRGKEF